MDVPHEALPRQRLNSEVATAHSATGDLNDEDSLAQSDLELAEEIA